MICSKGVKIATGGEESELHDALFTLDFARTSEVSVDDADVEVGVASEELLLLLLLLLLLMCVSGTTSIMETLVRALLRRLVL